MYLIGLKCSSPQDGSQFPHGGSLLCAGVENSILSTGVSKDWAVAPACAPVKIQHPNQLVESSESQQMDIKIL
jgi:hypothetical protein